LVLQGEFAGLSSTLAFIFVLTLIFHHLHYSLLTGIITAISYIFQATASANPVASRYHHLCFISLI
jgi:type IV secretory pathway VirB2 component (pilin)